MFVRALAMGIAVITSPLPSVPPSASPAPSASSSASPPPAFNYTLRCAGYGIGTFAVAGILVAIPKAQGADPSTFAPAAVAPLATRRTPVAIMLSSGTLAPAYWPWFAQGTSAKPVDCEIDRNDVDVTQRARFAVGGATIRNLSPAQPAPGSALGSPVADSVELDAASISLLTF